MILTIDQIASIAKETMLFVAGHEYPTQIHLTGGNHVGNDVDLSFEYDGYHVVVNIDKDGNTRTYRSDHAD